MGADERLTALKKAYADILLNTSKEAAARIMVSERKALRFQNELRVVKEDALRMLLRMKQMMDSKISEAESTCLSQQRKIEELEAQLHEAEDIVSDLRGELREAQAVLERVKINKESGVMSDRHNHHNNTVNREASKENRFCPSQFQDDHVAVSDIKNAIPSQRNESYNKSCSRLVHTGNSYLSHTDLPSIILRSKERELYRNGCTQRIRACEGNLLGNELSRSGKIEKWKTETDGRNDDNKVVCEKAVHMVDDAEKKLVEADSLVFFDSFQRKRKRAKRHGKGRVALDVKMDGQANNSDDAEKKVVGADSLVLFKSPQRKRKRAKRQRKHIADLDGSPPSPSLKMDGQPNNSCFGPPAEDPSEMAPISSPDRVEPVLHPGSAMISGNKPELLESCGVENTVSEPEGLAVTVEPPVQETGSTGSSGITVHKPDVEEGAGLLQKSDSKVADAKDEIYSPSRTFKYTFQRKRKRGASIELENGSIQNCNVVKNEEKQDVLSEHPQPKLSADSSRDSRRMAQVARQLISLSEKKWWQ